MDYDKLMSSVLPKASRCGCVPKRLLALHIGPYEDVLRILRRLSGTSSGCPRDVIMQKMGFLI